MTQEEPISTRTIVAIAAAACSATLAVGITVAALFGYAGAQSRPTGDGSGTTSEARAGGSTPTQAGVVLVPLQPATAAPAIEFDGEDPSALVLASARSPEREDRERGGHREDDDEREDD